MRQRKPSPTTKQQSPPSVPESTLRDQNTQNKWRNPPHLLVFLPFIIVAVGIILVGSNSLIYETFSKSRTFSSNDRTEEMNALNFRIAAYMPDYRWDHLFQHSVFLSKNVDDVYMFSLPFMVSPSEDIFMKTVSERFQANNLAPKLAALRKFGIGNIFITIGGAGEDRSGLLPKILKTKKDRTKFINGLLAYLNSFANNKLHPVKIEGVDFDPEIQLSEVDAKNFYLLIKELRNAFKGLMISLAVHPWQIKAYPIDIFNLVDRVNLMTYDMLQGQHSSFAHTFQAVKVFKHSGINPEKLFIGIPCYGRHEAKMGEVKTYSELINRRSSPEDKITLAHQDYDPSGFHFNGRYLVTQKVLEAKRLNLGGIFFWEAGQDLLETGFSLLEAAKDAVSVVRT